MASSSRRAFRWALAVAVVLHAPLASTLVPSWLRMLFRFEDAATPLSEEVVVPIDLDMGFEDQVPSTPKVSDADRTAVLESTDDEDGDALQVAAREKEAREKEAREKEAREKEAREKEAREKAAAPPIASAAPSSSSAPETSPHGVGNPESFAGQAGAVQAKGTNVMIYLATDRVRGQALATRLAGLLSKIPQWNELLGGTGLDPIRDFDHMWLTGPHMQTSRVVVAVVDYNVETPSMKRAIERAMAASSPPGAWLTKTPTPIGTLGDDGAQRVALRADKHVVIVAPAEAEADLRANKDIKFSKSGETILAMKVRSPWRAFARTPVPFPKTITALSLTLVPSGGGYTLKFEATDESPETARRSMNELAESIERIRAPFILAAFFEKPSFRTEGPRIFGETTVTSVQLSRILGIADTFLGMQSR